MTSLRALVATAARDVPHQAAVAWAHSAAVVAHAERLGLMEPAGSIQASVEKLAAAHPALAGFADPAVNPLWRHEMSPGFQAGLAERVEPLDGRPEREVGYALGDLYQELSVEARKGRALCQTPAFVSKLLLDLSVDPAVEVWGRDMRMVDPSCGTGHILVEAAIRLYAHHGRHIEDALAAVHGVDLDPYAALLARYRLLVLACRSGGRGWRLADAPDDLPIQVACADSLLDETEPLLESGRYHAVVANPPYITVKDAGVNAAIRARYPQVCKGTYSLALPFHALMTGLLVPGGWCAQLTANSFMKREFGKNYVENYLTQLDLTWVIDTSGAYIPGHGTPTVILVNRNQPPASDTVHAVLSIKGEPGVPADPARGLVWTAIRDAVDQVLSYKRFARGAQAALPVAEQSAETEAAQSEVEPVSYTQPNLFDLLVEAGDRP